MEIDLHRMPEMLGVPVIPVSARKRTGLDILMHTIAHHKRKREQCQLEHHHANRLNSTHIHKHHEEFAVVYSDEIEDKIDELISVLREKYPNLINYRWHAIKLLEEDIEVKKKIDLDVSHIVDRSYEQDIINQKYDFIEEIVEECVVNKTKKEESTDKIDQVLTNRFWGLPIFLGIMAMVFFLTFTFGDFLKGYFEIFLDYFSEGMFDLLTKIGAGEVVTSLVVDGIIAGVGGILTFLPNIFVLFFALALLEDSGYMARVAYVKIGRAHV